MEKKFTFTDGLMLLLLLLILIAVALQYIQNDRMWQMMQKLDQTNTEANNDRLAIRQGVLQMQRSNDRIVNLLDSINQSLASGVTIEQQPANGAANTPSSAMLQTTSLPAGYEAKPTILDRIDNVHDMDRFAIGGVVRDAFGATVKKITPLVSTDVYGSAIQGYILQSLTTLNPQTLEYEGLIARSWMVQSDLDAYDTFVEQTRPQLLAQAEADPSVYQAVLQEILADRRELTGSAPDPESEDYQAMRDIAMNQWIDDQAPSPITIKFLMRDDVTFSDGTPLTAKDVVFTFEMIMNPKIEAPRSRAYYAKIRDVYALNDHEVVFEYREPYFRALELAGGMQILPKHFYEQFTADEINSEPGLLMGSGPYRMETPTGWAPGKPLVLIRNQRYWGPWPAFERISYREISNPITRLTTFRNGEIDYFSAQPEQYDTLIEDEDIMDRAQNYEYEVANAGYAFIGWNQKLNGEPTIFADRRVRQAMTMLINRGALVNGLLRGYGLIPAGPFPPKSPQYNEAIEPWPYDVDRALTLLKEVGFEDRDGDGVLEDEQGEPLSFTVTYPSTEGGGGFWDQAMLLFRDGFARAGIDMQLNPLEWSVYGETLKSRDFEAISLGWGGGAIEKDIYQIFHSDQMADAGDNFVHYSNTKLDEVIREARRTLDRSKRMELWRQAHRYLHEDQPYTFLYMRKSLAFVDKRYQNVYLTPMGLNPRTEWFTPAAQQQNMQ